MGPRTAAACKRPSALCGNRRRTCAMVVLTIFSPLALGASLEALFHFVRGNHGRPDTQVAPVAHSLFLKAWCCSRPSVLLGRVAHAAAGRCVELWECWPI